MRKMLCRLTAGVLFAFLAAPVYGAHGAQVEPPWSLFAYGGQWTDTRFVRIVFRGQTDFQNAYVWVVGGSRNLYDVCRHLRVEGEVNTARNTGRQNHSEINTAFSLRWRTFPWDRYVDTSLAYGLGISHAFARPPIEEEPERRATRTLIFMPTELTFARPRSQGSPWEAMLRIHHRSGAFGVFKDAGGSNFVSLGVRYRFHEWRGF